MNAPFKTDALPQWNLGDLYSGRTDPKIETDLAQAKADNDALVALKGRFVAMRGEPLRLGELLDHGIGLYEAATNGLWGVGAYAGLASSTARKPEGNPEFPRSVDTAGVDAPLPLPLPALGAAIMTPGDGG